jgi:AraC-like DNA-binding protein
LTGKANTVKEVADLMGHENASKFAAAFFKTLAYYLLK